MARANSKYRRVYHFLSSRWAVEDLQKRRIKISVFDKVNDEKELRAYSIPEYEDACEDLIRFYTEQFCLLCFAPDYWDDHMWIEYGDGHRGVCLGFDIKRNQVNQVEYVPEKKVGELPLKLVNELVRQQSQQSKIRSSRNAGLLGPPSPLEKQLMDRIKPFLLTKFDKWSKEKELRAFLKRDEEEGGRYFADFKAQGGMFLQEVVLGRDCEISEDAVKGLVLNYPRQPILIRRMKPI